MYQIYYKSWSGKKLLTSTYTQEQANTIIFDTFINKGVRCWTEFIVYRPSY